MKKKFVWNRDRISAVITFLLSLFVIWQTSTIKSTLGKMAGGNEPGSKLFPYAVAIVMGICAIGKFITRGKPDKEPFVGGLKGWLRFFKIIAILAVYVFLLSHTGYLLTTFLGTFTLVYAMKDQHKVSPLKTAIFAAATTAVLYLVFGTLLHIKLPVGSLFK